MLKSSFILYSSIIENLLSFYRIRLFLMTDSVNKGKLDTVSTVSEGLNVNNDQQKEKQKDDLNGRQQEKLRLINV